MNEPTNFYRMNVMNLESQRRLENARLRSSMQHHKSNRLRSLRDAAQREFCSSTRRGFQVDETRFGSPIECRRMKAQYFTLNLSNRTGPGRNLGIDRQQLETL